MVEVAWDVGASRGRASSHVTIYYQMVGMDRLLSHNLVMWADVAPDVEVSPRQLHFAVNSTSESVQLLPGLIDKVVVTKALCSHAAFDARAVPTVDSEQGAAVVVDFDRRKWSDGSSEPSVFIYTNSTVEPCLTIPIIIEPAEEGLVK